MLDHRTESALEDGNKWHYQYDSMGQVITGEKKHSAGVSIPGMKFGYAFDGIGNRNSATINGRTGSYTADLANQYTERQIPGALEIRGRATTTARVTVNTESTQRLDEYFYKALTIDNSSTPQYPGVSILAVKNHVGPNDEDLQSETTGHLYLAKTPEVFTHDAEGNLTSDGRWTYTWDGENRLIRQETIATVPTDAKRKLEFAYDAESRRVRKQTSTWNGTTWVLQKDLRFLYDGWNLVAELDATNTMQRNFVWGLDLSRSPQGAGGVGGLLAIREGTESHLPAYDGNGNIMALVKASDESTSARYEYGPFGEMLVVEENGISNPFRFSTKYLDSETGLFYYGFRYYNPVTGSWPSRDPIEEAGGLNLYGFVKGNPLISYDRLGLVMMNLTPRTQRKAVHAMDRWNPNNGTFTVGGHGTLGNYVTDAQGRPLSAKRLADLIRVSPLFHKQNVTLYMCDTGVDISSSENFAQQLANELCVGVRAPEGIFVLVADDDEAADWPKDAPKRPVQAYITRYVGGLPDPTLSYKWFSPKRN